ncbi:MAG TPA: aldehyde dehydrogenase family protein [Thermoanaerobaculia bacterium]|nr:aldehyde dehydrogenase family protein [Thermoanaerobaculia bacterium]
MSAHPSRIPATPRAELDRAVAALAAGKARWANVTARQHVELLGRLSERFAEVADRWVDACLEAEGIPPAHPMAGEEWLAGPYLVLRNLRLLAASLADVAAGQRPRLPGPVTHRPGGQAAAQVFPASLYDRLFFPGVTAEVWLEAGVTPENLGETQAVPYFEGAEPGLCLVLGAGNVSSIGPMDALYKLFAERKVVLFKAHPVNDYLGPLLAEAFGPLIEEDALRVVYGGAEEGEYLTRHPEVDEIHITGSDKTVEAIVFGAGEQGAQRKAERRPLLAKAISSELGNVSPVLIVPGPWSRRDLVYQAENLVSMLANNAGFNCNAARVLITSRAWPQRQELLEEIRRQLRSIPTRLPYYPGARERWQRFVDAHPQAETFGDTRFDRLPWTLIPNLDAEREDEICFTTEAFAPVFAEVPLPGQSAAEFLAGAVEFANQRLWGTLNATLVVHPATLREESAERAFEQALADLEYGTVTVNHWAAVGYGLVVTPWGAYPGSDLYDIQSGEGFVHNSYLFSRIEKSVVYSPFRAFPKPPWFVSHKTSRQLGRALTFFEKDPSATRLPGIFRLALAG